MLDLLSAVVTTGDVDNIRLLDKFGIRYMEHPNEPLGAKHNAALTFAPMSTHYMILPSDDLVSVEWIEACTRYKYASVRTCALVEVGTGRAKLLTNKLNAPTKFGACRVFAREVVDAVGGKLWSDHVRKGLDKDSHARVSAAGYHMEFADVRGPAFVDLKGPGSLWGFDVFSGDQYNATDALWMCSADVRSMVI